MTRALKLTSVRSTTALPPPLPRFGALSAVERYYFWTFRWFDVTFKNGSQNDSRCNIDRAVQDKADYYLQYYIVQHKTISYNSIFGEWNNEFLYNVIK